MLIDSYRYINYSWMRIITIKQQYLSVIINIIITTIIVSNGCRQPGQGAPASRPRARLDSAARTCCLLNAKQWTCERAAQAPTVYVSYTHMSLHATLTTTGVPLQVACACVLRLAAGALAHLPFGALRGRAGALAIPYTENMCFCWTWYSQSK